MQTPKQKLFTKCPRVPVPTQPLLIEIPISPTSSPSFTKSLTYPTHSLKVCSRIPQTNVELAGHPQVLTHAGSSRDHPQTNGRPHGREPPSIGTPTQLP